jgi:Predicted nucleotide-binding protein containing TIR-like domain
MAPECTGNLAALDLKIIGSEVECEVERLDVHTAVEPLHVSWNAVECPEGADAIGNGIVFVWRPPGYYLRRYPSKPDRLNGGFSWVHPVQYELMLILALPPGYVLRSVDDASPTLVRCKEVGQSRMAAYWIFNDGRPHARAQVSWKMEPFTGNLSTHLAALNHEAEKRAPMRPFGTIIDGEHVERTQPPTTTFIIHGHDHSGVKQLRGCISELQLPAPVVMMDELIAGATLPEKFEQLAESASLAIALLTPDDLGGPAAGHGIQSLFRTSSSTFSRARQNAWLEVGWFWGRWGRDHIMLLVKGDIEIPSDLRGLEYYTYRENVSEVSERIRKFYEDHRAA